MTREFPNLQIRPATLADALLLLQWRNDPVTRQNSRNQAVIEGDAHMAWFKMNLHEIYIVEDMGVPVGTVRAEKGKESPELSCVLSCELSYELSWTVAPHARGLGYGKAMLLQFVRDIIPNHKITAIIEEGNKPSEAIAKALGLKKTKPENPQAPRQFMLWQ